MPLGPGESSGNNSPSKESVLNRVVSEVEAEFEDRGDVVDEGELLEIRDESELIGVCMEIFEDRGGFLEISEDRGGLIEIFEDRDGAGDSVEIFDNLVEAVELSGAARVDEGPSSSSSSSAARAWNLFMCSYFLGVSE